MTDRSRTDALLARMGDNLHLADGGVETVMVFLNGIDLPQFASFPLLAQPEGRAALRA